VQHVLGLSETEEAIIQATKQQVAETGESASGQQIADRLDYKNNSYFRECRLSKERREVLDLLEKAAEPLSPTASARLSASQDFPSFGLPANRQSPSGMIPWTAHFGSGN
jgi:hypothetical protein